MRSAQRMNTAHLFPFYRPALSGKRIAVTTVGKYAWARQGLCRAALDIAKILRYSRKEGQNEAGCAGSGGA
jgi:hypothetical protein